MNTVAVVCRNFIVMAGLAFTLTLTACSSAEDTNPPSANNVTISGTAQVGETLTGVYTYADPNNDPEGTSTFRWLRNGTAITGATTISYTLVEADLASLIMFEVTPVSTKAPTKGTAARSIATAPILGIGTPAAPTASAVSISGTTRIGQVLTGHYTYTDANHDPETGSTFRWLRNSTEIAGATSITYTLGADDLASLITFEVTPVTNATPTTGIAVVSNPTGAITLGLNLEPQSVKTFHFSWIDINGEAEYRLQENPDSISGYTTIATIAADATSYDLEVSLPKRVNASYIIQACDSLNVCTDSDPVYVSGTLATAVGYIKASNTEASDYFGSSLALSTDGTTLAVGAYGEDSIATGVAGNQASNAASASGAVYVFTKSGTTWVQQAYLKAINTEAGDNFGWRVALASDGNTLAVGAPYEDSNATGIGIPPVNNTENDSGAVYVFSRSGSTWSQEAYVKASNTNANDYFGISLGLSADGNTLAVGASGEDSAATGIDGIQTSNTATDSGAAYVFTRSGTAWSQQAYIKASNTDISDGFGVSIALAADGDTLAVGATGEDSDATGIDGSQGNNTTPIAQTSSGAAYVYSRSGSTWSQQAYVKASNTQKDDHFGDSLALAADGNTLAVGATDEDSIATGIAGNQTSNTATDSGAVYVFIRSGITWSQQAYVKATNTGAGDQFGICLAFTDDGNTLAIGASGEDSNVTSIDDDQNNNSAIASGAVYVLGRTGTTWSQQAYIKATNTEAGDQFGHSVALNTDGNTLVVGAQNEDSSATGIAGNQGNNLASDSGAVFVY